MGLWRSYRTAIIASTVVVTIGCVFITRAGVAAQAPAQAPAYVGSAACSSCHTAQYNRWKNTRMANVVRDPKQHPDAVIPDFTKPDPLVTFTTDQIALVYGTKWKQRYFTKVGDDYF